MGEFIQHDEKTVVGVAIWFAIHDDKAWASISEEEKAVYRLLAWELLDYLYVLEVRRIA